MASKAKKISVNVLEKCVKEADIESVTTIEWNGIDVTVKRRLGLHDMIAFVDRVVKSCFTTEDGAYMPEARDFALRCSVLETYANFTLPSNIEKCYDLVYGCSAFDAVVENIDEVQFRTMIDAIDEKIDNVVRSNADVVMKQINELYASLSGLEENLSSIFSGINKEDITSIAQAISKSQIDEVKLMNAYLANKNKDDETTQEV